MKITKRIKQIEDAAVSGSGTMASRDVTAYSALPPLQRAPLPRGSGAFEALREEARTLKTLNRMNRAVTADLDLDRVVQVVTDVATELSGAAVGAFFSNVGAGARDPFPFHAFSGAASEVFANFLQADGAPLLEPIFTEKSIVRSADLTSDPRYGAMVSQEGTIDLPPRSCLGVPVISRTGEILGGLFFGHPQPNVFSRRAERLIAALAAQAAIAIDNARLYQASQHEVAERKRAEQALREADQRKNEFLAVLAHELRNPLAPLRNALQIVRMADRDAPAVNEALGVMERQIGQMVRLIDDLMDVSRISRGKIELKKTLVDLNEVLTSAVETSRPVLEEYRHTLSVEPARAPIHVDADSVRLAQVFSNLLNNAAKYTTPHGRIRVVVGRDGAQATVRFIDNGIGIPADMLPRIFDMFAQVSHQADNIRGGLGIGLSISRRLAEMHGGTLEARSDGHGKGAEFIVRLPIAQHAARVSVQRQRRAPECSGRRILVADDNEDSVESLATLLELMGNEVRIARDGGEAVSVAAAFRPEVILLDIGMPGVSGNEACRQIRAQNWGGDALIIALTGWGQEEHKRKSREAGFDYHLVKPADFSVIERILRDRS